MTTANNIERNLFEIHNEQSEQHFQAHLEGTTIINRHIFKSCIFCYPILPTTSQTENFENFLTWVQSVHSIRSYSGYSLTAFNTLVTSYQLNPDKFPQDTDYRLTVSLFFSFTYFNLPESYQIHNQFLNCFIRSNCFESLNHLYTTDFIPISSFSTESSENTPDNSFLTNTTNYYTPENSPKLNPIIIQNPVED